MIRWFVPLTLAALPALAEPDLPSGLEVSLLDSFAAEQPDGEIWLIRRYLAPAISGGATSYEEVIDDLDFLCTSEGLAAAEEAGGGFAQIQIVLLDRQTDWGVPAPEVTQFIGAYLLGDGECVWNDF